MNTFEDEDVIHVSKKVSHKTRIMIARLNWYRISSCRDIEKKKKNKKRIERVRVTSI